MEQRLDAETLQEIISNMLLDGNIYGTSSVVLNINGEEFEVSDVGIDYNWCHSEETGELVKTMQGARLVIYGE